MRVADGRDVNDILKVFRVHRASCGPVDGRYHNDILNVFKEHRG